MPDQQIQWQLQPKIQPPTWFLQAVRQYIPTLSGHYAAQLLWQRGIQEAEQLAGFLNPQMYQPASPFEFGQEMNLAVERLKQARESSQIVAIWGDFDADGITATSVLWEGLGQFFPQNQESIVRADTGIMPLQNSKLFYYIPNRLTESHGLNCPGIDRLASLGCQLIVTCDTGSTNISEIEYAQELGIDVIVTDHHTLPNERPPVTAIINPRYFSPDSPLYHLSGVAVAYKLVEALYQTLPDVPQQPVENLLDLVAIGLIADLVQLSGDCRYLAQRGIERLQQQAKQRNRPGIAKLLELCQRSGDRPTDISFGLGPRINAVSRIQGDATFCVELLTSRDEKRCEKLAYDTELANSRRKSLQKDVVQQVKRKLTEIDLSTTSIIVLMDTQWAVGVLGLVAGQIAQEYGRPTILLSTEAETDEENSQSKIARGSARSINQIDLYQLVKEQSHLLHRFGGHPLAAGLSLPVENIPMFVEAINRKLRQLMGTQGGTNSLPIVQADLVVTVAELGKELFHELKLLEPCGMGNPSPRLLIQNCWFENIYNRNIQDFKGKKVQYIKTELEIWDDSTNLGFPGLWWGHYKEEVPEGRCDAIVELDYNNHKKRPEIRIIAVRPSHQDNQFSLPHQKIDWILDWRTEGRQEEFSQLPILLEECPTTWNDLQVWFRRAMQTNQKLAIAYPPPQSITPIQIWQQLIGIAKYLSRTGKTFTIEQLHQKLGLSDRTLHLGMKALSNLGFQISDRESEIKDAQHFQILSYQSINMVNPVTSQLIEQFLAVVQEEQFRQKYFSQIPLSTIQAEVLQE